MKQSGKNLEACRKEKDPMAVARMLAVHMHTYA